MKYVAQGALLRCLNCHHTVMPGQKECGFCGASMTGEPGAIDGDSLSWQERGVIVAGWLLILHGVGCVMDGMGWLRVPLIGEPYSGMGGPFVGVPGIVEIAVGCGLLRDLMWVRAAARWLGAAAILTAGRLALISWLWIAVVDGALGQAWIWTGITVFWVFLEIVLWGFDD